MSNNNVEIVKGIYALYAAQDIEKVLDLFTDDISFHATSGFDKDVPEKTYVGKDGFLELLGKNQTSTVESGAFENLTFFGQGETVLAVGQVTCTRKSNGFKINLECVHKWQLNSEGKVVSFYEYCDPVGWAQLYV